MLSPTFDLQPMSTGDILDRTIRLYRRHFLHTLAIVSLPYILIIPIWALLGATAWGQARPAPWQNPALVAVLVPSILAYLWLCFVSMGALARSVSEGFLGGTPTIWTVYSPILRRSLSLIWAYFLAGLAGGAVLSAGVALFALGLFLAQQFPTTAGYVIAAVLGITITHHHENLPQGRLAWLCGRCGIFLCPSWDEEIGMPSMEAMACGAALVTYDNGSCRDYALDGQTALVARRRDVAHLAEQLELAVCDPGLRAKLAQERMAYIKRKFYWGRAAAKLEPLFGQPAGEN